MSTSVCCQHGYCQLQCQLQCYCSCQLLVSCSSQYLPTLCISVFSSYSYCYSQCYASSTVMGLSILEHSRTRSVLCCAVCAMHYCVVLRLVCILQYISQLLIYYPHLLHNMISSSQCGPLYYIHHSVAQWCAVRRASLGMYTYVLYVIGRTVVQQCIVLASLLLNEILYILLLVCSATDPLGDTLSSTDTVSSSVRLKQALALVVHVVCCAMLCMLCSPVLYYDHCVYYDSISTTPCS